MRFLTLALVLAFSTWAPCAFHSFSASPTEAAKHETLNSQRQRIQKRIDQKFRELDRKIENLKCRAPKKRTDSLSDFSRK